MKTSDDAFDNTPPSAREIPDYESDPFRLVSQQEDHLVETYHFNLQGDPVMTATKTQLATALAAAGVTHTRGTYFDLLEHLDEKLQDEQLRSRVFSSLAWIIDNAVINAARQMFYRDYKNSDGDGTRDAYNEFVDNFLSNLDKNADGGEFSEGVAVDLVKLLGIRHSYHDMASRAASAINREYNPRSFQDLLLSDKPAPVTALTAAKLAQIAKFVAEDDEDLEKQTILMLTSKQEFRNKDLHESRKALNPLVLGIIDVAERHAIEDVRFDQLDVKLQERFIGNAEATVNRAITDLASYNSIDMVTFALILKEAKAVKASLNEILATKFRDAETNAMVNAAHRAKAERDTLVEKKNTDPQAKEELEALDSRKEKANAPAATEAIKS